MLKVLQIAQAEVGYREKASAAQLDDKAANAGSGNYTKYARDMDALGDFYNGPKPGQLGSAGRIYTTDDENGYPSYSIK